MNVRACSLWDVFGLMFVYVVKFGILLRADCPGPQSESAGKSDSCEGCPNQQICATAPKGPDPGFLSISFYCFCSLPLFIASVVNA